MPQLQANNKMIECKMLLNWMRVVVRLNKVRTCTMPPQDINTVRVLKPNLVLLMIDLALYQHQEEIIN